MPVSAAGEGAGAPAQRRQPSRATGARHCRPPASCRLKTPRVSTSRPVSRTCQVQPAQQHPVAGGWSVVAGAGGSRRRVVPRRAVDLRLAGRPQLQRQIDGVAARGWPPPPDRARPGGSAAASCSASSSRRRRPVCASSRSRQPLRGKTAWSGWSIHRGAAQRLLAGMKRLQRRGCRSRSHGVGMASGWMRNICRTQADAPFAQLAQRLAQIDAHARAAAGSPSTSGSRPSSSGPIERWVVCRRRDRSVERDEPVARRAAARPAAHIEFAEPARHRAELLPVAPLSLPASSSQWRFVAELDVELALAGGSRSAQRQTEPEIVRPRASRPDSRPGRRRDGSSTR